MWSDTCKTTALFSWLIADTHTKTIGPKSRNGFATQLKSTRHLIFLTLNCSHFTVRWKKWTFNPKLNNWSKLRLTLTIWRSHCLKVSIARKFSIVALLITNDLWLSRREGWLSLIQMSGKWSCVYRELTKILLLKWLNYSKWKGRWHNSAVINPLLLRKYLPERAKIHHKNWLHHRVL